MHYKQVLKEKVKDDKAKLIEVLADLRKELNMISKENVNGEMDKAVKELTDLRKEVNMILEEKVNSDKAKLIEVLAERRKELNMSYIKLSLCTDISDNNIRRFFKGEFNMGINNILKLCYVLGVEMHYSTDQTMKPLVSTRVRRPRN